MSYHPGASNGLYLRLNVNQSQYFSSLTASAGFRVNMDGWMDIWINGSMDQWINGLMEGWMD